MSGHYTPGPWKVYGSGTDGKYEIDTISGTKTAPICTIKLGVSKKSYGSEEGRANAILIATAPEMLDALREVLDTYTHMTSERFRRGDDHDARELMQRVIAQAEGAIRVDQ